MSTIHVEAARTIASEPDAVYRFISDYRQSRPRILPSNYEGYIVEKGGKGAGTVVRYVLHAGGRQRAYEMHVMEPGQRTLVERDAGSSLVTTWHVTPTNDASKARVIITTEWQGGSGVGGFFERTFAPGGVRRIYRDMLQRLEGEMTSVSREQLTR